MNSLIKPTELSSRDAFVLVAAFVAFRCLTVVGFYFITGGKELASDIQFHELIINDPLGILKGTAFEIASYPPFQWVIEWSVFNAYNTVFSEMISYRMLMVSVEFFSFLLAIKLFQTTNTRRSIALIVLALFILSPHQYFSSIFFVQEDVIAQMFMLIAILFLLNGNRALSIVTMVLGVLIAKLFFVIPVFYIVLFYGNRTFIKRILDGLLALAPLVIVYVFIITQALKNGGEVPIRDFTPHATYAANFWVILIDQDAELLMRYKNYSLVLTVAAQLLIIAVCIHVHWIKKVTLHPAILMVVPLAFFFGTFYQHMPEYLLMLWPIAALLFTSIWQQVLLVAALVFAWTPRITHGFNTVVEGIASTDAARSAVVGPLVNVLNLDFKLLNYYALIAETIVYSIVLIWLCVASVQFVQRRTKTQSSTA